MVRVLLLAVLAGGLLAAAPNNHPVIKVGPAVQSVSHRCDDAKCERCPCADGYHCANWRHEARDGQYEHRVDCVKDSPGKS